MKVNREGSTPLFHIDIHGKKDKETNMSIDLGIKALKKTFDPADNDFVKNLKDKFVDNSVSAF